MKLIESVKKHTNSEFIKSAEKIHQDLEGEPLYSYLKTEYVGSKFPVIVTCKKCGEDFILRASHHINGVGCKRCAIKRKAKLRFSNTDEFIEKSKKIHGNKYNYDNVEYINNKIKVKIYCKNVVNIFYNHQTFI